MEGAVHAAGMTAEVQLIETLLWDGRCAPRAAAHLDRAERSAGALGFAFDRSAALAALAGVAAGAALRLRMTFARDGTVALTAAALPPPANTWVVRLSDARLDPADPWLRHKTTRRVLYDETRAALPDGIDEVIFANHQGAICEGTISTLFFDAGNGLATPPVTCGLLPGVLRAALIAEGRVREVALPMEDLGRVRLWCGNALRGLIPARLG